MTGAVFDRAQAKVLMLKPVSAAREIGTPINFGT